MAFIVITSSYGLADISFKYDADVVATVKTIPSKVWNAEGKYWTIWASHIPVLANMLTARGHTVSVNGEHWVRAGGNAGPFEPLVRKKTGNLFKDFFDSLPEEYRVKAYRALAKAFHPDQMPEVDMELVKLLTKARP